MKLRSVIAGIAAAMMFSQSASALSCMRPDLAKTMEEAKASEKLYYVLVGKLTYDPANLPPKHKFNGQQGHPPRITPAMFHGYALTPDARSDVPLSGYPVDVEVSCAGPWCGGLPSEQSTRIAFVEAREGLPPVLKVSACPGMTFETRPNDGQVEKLRTCFDKTCQSDRPDYY